MTVVLLIKTEFLVVQGKLWGLDNDMECQLRKHKKTPLSSLLLSFYVIKFGISDYVFTLVFF
jgi:hypothetical protein